jgi:hypothetical protein
MEFTELEDELLMIHDMLGHCLASPIAQDWREGIERARANLEALRQRALQIACDPAKYPPQSKIVKEARAALETGDPDTVATFMSRGRAAQLAVKELASARPLQHVGGSMLDNSKPSKV